MHKREFFLVLGALMMIAISAAVGYWVGSEVTTPEFTKSPGTYNPDYLPAPGSEYIPATTTPPAPEKEILPLSSYSLPKEIGTKLQWHEKMKLGNLGLTYTDGINQQYSNEEYGDGYFEIANFTHNNKPGKLILMIYGNGEMGGPSLARLIQYDDKFIVLPKYTDYFDEKSYDFEKVVKDANFSIPALDYPETLSTGKTRQVITRNSGSFFLSYKPNNLEPAFRDAKWGQVYTSTSTGGFYLDRPDGLTEIYTFEPDFKMFVWNDGTQLPLKTQTGDYFVPTYMPTTPGGCGMRNFLAVVEDVSITKDLVKVGKNDFGEAIYGLKDANHEKLKIFYDSLYSPYREDKITYEEFVAGRPLVYWVDPFGRLIEFMKNDYAPMAECAKPVIYLYPTKTTDVDVLVAPQGGFTYTEPRYYGGWKVTAEPNGRLTEISTQRVYPYLYWEGLGDYYEMPQQGFVVQQKHVEMTLRTKLRLLGLNKQETKDFLEFWLPRMQDKPYYFITFMGNRHMEAIAPLTVIPKPDTVVRILMDFQGLDAPKKVQPLKLPKTPVRKGFTVIEWGGVKR